MSLFVIPAKALDVIPAKLVLSEAEGAGIHASPKGKKLDSRLRGNDTEGMMLNMSHSIRITIGKLEFKAELNDTATAGRLYEALPIDGQANLWGKEIYFDTPVKADNNDNKRAEMGIGELAFWPQGQAVCIFWGTTPVSLAGEPRAVSPVVPIGQLKGDLKGLDDVNDADVIRLEKAG